MNELRHCHFRPSLLSALNPYTHWDLVNKLDTMILRPSLLSALNPYTHLDLVNKLTLDANKLIPCLLNDPRHYHFKT